MIFFCFSERKWWKNCNDSGGGGGGVGTEWSVFSGIIHLSYLSEHSEPIYLVMVMVFESLKQMNPIIWHRKCMQKMTKQDKKKGWIKNHRIKYIEASNEIRINRYFIQRFDSVDLLLKSFRLFSFVCSVVFFFSLFHFRFFAFTPINVYKIMMSTACQNHTSITI